MDIQDAYDWNQFLRGDKAAFEKLYFKYINALYAYGIRISRNETLVEDCLQDLFSDLWEKRKRLAQVDSVRAYLFVAIKRRVLRKLSAERKNSFVSLDEFVIQLDFMPELEDKLEDERAALLKKAFMKLSLRQQEVIYLRFYNQLSYEETAQVMEVQVKAVYKLMARSIQRLKEQLSSPIQHSTLIAILASFWSSSY